MSSGKIKDKILFLKLKQKDKDAFIEAYDAYVDDIYRFIFFKVGTKEEAEDLSSQVFLKAWEHIQNNSLKDYNTIKALFYRIARNLVIDHYRKKSIRNEVSLDSDLRAEGFDMKDEKADLVKEIDTASDISDINEKLMDLKDEYREVIILRYINELSTKEIAKLLGKKTGNIRVLIYRAIQALKNSI